MDPLPDFLTRTEFGGIRLTGSRIGLEHVVEKFVNGESPEEIHLQYDHLTLAHIYKVCGFYLEHRAAADEYVRRGLEQVERLAAANPGPSLADLRRRSAALAAIRKSAASQ